MEFDWNLWLSEVAAHDMIDEPDIEVAECIAASMKYSDEETITYSVAECFEPGCSVYPFSTTTNLEISVTPHGDVMDADCLATLMALLMDEGFLDQVVSEHEETEVAGYKTVVYETILRPTLPDAIR